MPLREKKANHNAYKLENSMNIVDVNINDLNEADYNPRTLTEKQFNEIKLSIEKFGFVEPIVINSNKDRKNIVIGGHQRLKVAKQLGYETAPCYKVSLTKKKEKELNIRLNANVGSWDWDKIANEWNYTELEAWGLKIPVTDFSSELLDFGSEDSEDSELMRQGSSNFLVPMTEESKIRILQTLGQVKIDNDLESNEDALIVLCGVYMENRE